MMHGLQLPQHGSPQPAGRSQGILHAAAGALLLQARPSVQSPNDALLPLCAVPQSTH